MFIKIESKPTVYKFTGTIDIESLESDGEFYLKILMEFYSKHNFKTVNGNWKRDVASRLSNRHDSTYDEYNVIKCELKVERIVTDTHSPSEYNYRYYHEIYDVFKEFKEKYYPDNDDDLERISYASTRWAIEDIRKHNIFERIKFKLSKFFS